jgi:hypothetical protein
MAYFTIWQGLRGCYMPDASYIIRADTRRELKQALTEEAFYIRDAGYVGLNKRAIASLAAMVWRNRHRSGEYVAPYRWPDQTHAPYALGVFTGASRADYLAQQET